MQGTNNRILRKKEKHNGDWYMDPSISLEDNFSRSPPKKLYPIYVHSKQLLGSISRIINIFNHWKKAGG